MSTSDSVAFLVEAAADGTHAKVLSLAQQMTPGRLLDAPSGAGALAAQLEKRGFVVTGLDIVQHPQLQLQPAQLTLADLNRPLPFPNQSFDQVVSVEGIEHLESPPAFVRELARVLVPGGHLLLSTPNVLNLASRWRWLFRGHHKHFTPDAQRHFSSGHIFAVDWVLLSRLLLESGFEIRSVTSNRWLRGWRERLLAPLVRWSMRRHPQAAEVLSDDLLFGQVLIVHAQKVR